MSTGRAARASRDLLAHAATVAGYATAQDLMHALEAATDNRLRLPGDVASQADADTIGRELAALVPEMERRLDAMLAAVRGIDLASLVPDAIELVRDRWRLPWPWLAWQLVDAWGQEAAAGGLGRIGVVRVGVVVDGLAAPAPTIAFETRPGETITDVMLRSPEEVYAPLEAAADAAALRCGKRVPLAVAPRMPAAMPNPAQPIRYRFSARRLTGEQGAEVVALAGRQSLRALAGRFGVSHETTRAVLRQATEEAA